MGFGASIPVKRTKHWNLEVHGSCCMVLPTLHSQVKEFYFFSAQDLLKKILPFWDDMTDMDSAGLDKSFALSILVVLYCCVRSYRC